MRSPDEQKKRPPPILIPPLPHRPVPAVPGPNAFAIAAKAKRDEAERQAKQSQNNASLVSLSDGGQYPRQGMETGNDSSGISSAMTTFTQLLEAAGPSPSKSASRSSSTSRHGSTTRSRHSNRSQRSTGSTHPLLREDAQDKSAKDPREGQAEQSIFKIDEEEDKTVRSDIEKRADEKAMKLMGQVPRGAFVPLEHRNPHTNIDSRET
jgi:hypothetical protein